MNEKDYNGATMTISDEAVQLHMVENVEVYMRISEYQYIILYTEAGESAVH